VADNYFAVAVAGGIEIPVGTVVFEETAVVDILVGTVVLGEIVLDGEIDILGAGIEIEI